MFYASEDAATAVMEISTGGNSTFVIGEFELLRPAVVLNLTNIPAVPSLFDGAQFQQDREALSFLRYFGREMSKPIRRDQRAHIEYVPTQVVTEYFRSFYRYEGKPIDGIRYLSAQNKKSSYVFFADQNDVVPSRRDLANLSEEKLLAIRLHKPWIKLVSKTSYLS